MKELRQKVASASLSRAPMSRLFETRSADCSSKSPTEFGAFSTMKYDMKPAPSPNQTGSNLMHFNSVQIADHSLESSRFVSRSKAFSRVAAVLVMLAGAVAMIGWLTNVAGLKSIYGDITMKASTALALMLMGASLWALRNADHKSSRRIGQVCAATAAFIGLLTLTEHVTGWNLHIDQLLFTEPPGALATTSPGRMGITASSCFIMFGIAMLLLYRRRAISFAQGLSIISGFWALVAIIGYAYGAQALFGSAAWIFWAEERETYGGKK